MAPKPLAAIRRIVASTDHVIIEGFRAMSRGVSRERDPDWIPSRSGCFAETCRCHRRRDLTRTDDCLVCGAYEAVAAGTPLIVSDTAALRSYCCKGTIYTKNTPSEIRQAIVIALAQVERLREEMIVLRNELNERWQAQRDDLRRLMDALAARGHGNGPSPSGILCIATDRDPIAPLGSASRLI